MLFNLEDVKSFCKDNNLELLYLSKFGSHLYGTNTEKSDTDFKGIFLPSKKQLLLGNLQSFPAFSTGNDESKNDAEDTDCELWSLHNFIRMIGRGDTGAVDLLYSISNKSAFVFKDHRLNTLFENPLKFFNPLKAKAFVGYAMGQANRYSVKGTRLGVLKNVYDWVLSLNEKDIEGERLEKYLPFIKKNFSDGNICKVTEMSGPNKKNTSGLQLVGKEHQSNTMMLEFVKRIKTQYETYGKRAHAAEEAGGLDFKALSHAIRAIYQMEELLLTGKIDFPLKDRELILSVKNGNLNWDEINKLIYEGIDRVDTLIAKIENGLELPSKTQFNQGFIDDFVLSFY